MAVIAKDKAKDSKTSKVSSKGKKSSKEEKSFAEATKEYFKGVGAEFKKITWPGKQQVISETLVVLAMTAFVTLLILFLDNVFLAIFSLLERTY